MRALGRLLGGRQSLTKLAIQHTAARARVGYCVASASHPTASVAKLEEINLQGTALSEPALIELCRALMQRGASGPVDLNLEGCIRRSAGALPALWKLISDPNCALTALNLGYNALRNGAEIGLALVANSENGGKLIELDIGSNELGAEFVDGGICALCAPLSAPAPAASAAAPATASAPATATPAAPEPTPTTATSTTPTPPPPLTKAIGCRVQTLDLSYTPLGLKGGQSLANMLLTKGCNVTSLRLDGCGLGADGVAALSTALANVARCAPLQSLRLEYNSLGPEGMKSLAAALPFRLSLNALFIGCNGLGEEGARHLAGAASTCANLKTLDVGDNDLSESALRMLLEGVRSQYALTALDVSNNRLGDGGAEALAQEVRTNPSLLFVRAAGNGIGRVGGAALAAAVSASSVMLDLQHNYSVEYDDQMAIKLSNNRRMRTAPPSPLDGWGKREE